MPMNPVEREVMGICIALEAINDMANHELFDVLVSSSYPEESEVRFKSRIHQEMFLLRLLDFTKEAGALSITGVQGSCLEVLGADCKSRCFEVNGSVTRLAESVKNLRVWLDVQDTLALSITNFEIETEIELRREQLVFILGNQVKHNIARLTGVSKLVGNLLLNTAGSTKGHQW